MTPVFDAVNFKQLCDRLAKQDAILKTIIVQYSYPPFWTRPATFETLVHIILEQQVSLASARAALLQLKEKMGSITPQKALALSDAEMRACYCSRQKTGYIKDLATAIVEGRLSLTALASMDNATVRHQLKQIKGIGDWTADVFLMMVLHRCDLFPVGDIALINSVRHQMGEPHLTKENILELSTKWQPYKTIAAFLFWHAYVQRKGIIILP